MAGKMNQAGKGSGKRRRFRGRMGVPVKKDRNNPRGVSPRSHSHGGHSQARSGWTCDDTKDPRFGKTGKQTKSSELGPYKVVVPRNRVRYVKGA